MDDGFGACRAQKARQSVRIAELFSHTNHPKPPGQNCEALLERQFLMQGKENPRESPCGDVGLPAFAGISLCENAEPFVVVKWI